MTRRSLRLPEVEKKIGLKKTQILEAVKQGNFPKPFHAIPGGRAIVWDEGEIDEHLANQMARHRIHTTGHSADNPSRVTRGGKL